MNWLDMVILLPVAYGVCHGLWVGAVREVGSLLGLIAGVVLAKLFSPVAAAWLVEAGAGQQVAQMLGYVAVFIGVALACNLLARGLTNLLKHADLGSFNRLLGALAGLLKYGLIVSVLLNLMTLIDTRMALIPVQVREASVSYEPVMRLAGVAWDEWNDRINAAEE